MEAAAPPAEDTGDFDDLVSVLTDPTFKYLSNKFLKPFSVYIQEVPQCL